MGIESTLSIVASVLAIGGAIWGGYKLVKQKPLTALMTELADKNTSIKRQHRILSIIDKLLMLFLKHISSAYINGFHSNGRSKLAIFYDICNENNIEPTTEICKLLLGSDEKKFRNEWTTRHLKTNSNATISTLPETKIPKTAGKDKKGTETVYLSAILAEQYAEALAKLKEVFPNKVIETIDYNDIALTGGILNCTTWIKRK